MKPCNYWHVNAYFYNLMPFGFIVRSQIKGEYFMKLKTISLIGLLFTATVSSGSAFAQKVIQLVTAPKGSITLNQESAKEFNLDLEKIKSSLNAQEGDEVFANLDENGDIINLGIYNNREFAGSRVDRDGVGH